jgi:hypothetical protein
MLPRYAWPSSLSDIIQATLGDRFGLDVKRHSKLIAESIYRLSCYYRDYPMSVTPWHETWAQVAQLVYFLPLNYLRFSAAMDQLPRDFWKDEDWVLDFGAGLSPVYWYLRFQRMVRESSFWAVDVRKEPKDLMGLMGFPSGHYHLVVDEADIRRLVIQGGSKGGNTLVLSFSLTENNLSLLRGLMPLFTRVVIIEPGLQKDARALMSLREEFIKGDWQVLAPCVHQRPCPLLKWSARDWCHFQISPLLPEWFLELLDALPLHTDEHLSYSFLVIEKKGARKRDGLELDGSNHMRDGPSDERKLVTNVLKPEARWQDHWDVPTGSKSDKTTTYSLRVIGAARAEKGKTTQAVCLDDERRFLVWPHRAFGKEPPVLSWGAVSTLPAGSYQEKGQPSHREMVKICV